VTDTGLKAISKLKSLSELHLVGTKVTDAGVRDIQAALPSVRVRR